MPWFPDWHRGTPEEVAAFDKASRELNDYSDRAWLANGRRPVPETEQYHELNDRANETAAKLSPWQRSPLAQDLREARDGLAERRKRRVQRRSRGR